MSPYHEPWTEYATCRSVGPTMFYPEPGDSWTEAITVCQTACPVRLQCLDFAMRNEVGRPDSAQTRRVRRLEAASAMAVRGRVAGRRGGCGMTRHGTKTAMYRHRTAREPLCDECRPLWNEYMAALKEAKPQSKQRNAEETAMDRVLAKRPPKIKWRKNRHGVFEAVSIVDPHADTSTAEQSRRLRVSAARAERDDAAKRAERSRLDALKLMQEEAAAVAERLRKHRAENTPLMAAARKEI